MRHLYKSGGYKGGEIKSSYDEEWSFSADGILQSEIIIGPELKFRWDGEMLVGLNPNSTQLGSGKWNGISIKWMKDNSSECLLQFDWDFFLREYTNNVDKNVVWKWTRHFLASKFGSGEWIVEGSVPEPVVMFLQIIRYFRERSSFV